MVRHGLYANKENELFRIDVIGISDPTGASEAAIDEYSSTVKVCLDYEPSEAGGPSEGEGKPETSVDAPPFGQESLEDLIIVSAVEALLASEEDPDKVIEELGSSNPNGWRDTLEKQFQALPPVEQPYLINSIFDPKASNKATHHYAEVKSTKVWAKISSMNGSVKAGLCRGLSTDTYKTVSVNNGTPSLPVSRNLYSSSTSTWSYDLSVRGNATGLYRVALQDGWDGWYRGYFSDPPTDSKHTCTVDL